MPNVFITRDLKKNSIFRKALKVADFEIIDQSLITFSPTLFSEIPSANWLFFYSKNGVEFFFQNAPRPLSTNIKWAVLGEGTATALQQQNIQPDFIGNGHPKATSEAFLSIAVSQSILFVRAKNSKQSVQKLLKGKIEMSDLVVYENSIKEHFSIPFCDYLVFTSPLNATAYFQKYTWQSNQTIVAIGATTATTLQQLGIKKILIAPSPSEHSLATTVLKHFSNLT